MKGITIGSINYKLIYPILVSVFCFLNYLSYEYLIRESDLKDYYPLNILFEPISLSLCGILSLISKWLVKQAKEERELLIVPQEDQLNNSIETHRFSFLEIHNKDKFPCIQILIVSLSSLIFLLFSMYNKANNLVPWLNEISKFYQLICTAFFSFFNL